MKNKRFTTNIVEAIEPKHYLATTQRASNKNKVIYQLELFKDYFNEECGNKTGLSINETDKAIIDNNEQTLMKFNDLEVLKQFKNQKTIDNIQHLDTILIDILYRKFYFKDKISADHPKIKFDYNFFKSFVSKNITEIKEFLGKYKIFNKECIFFSYKKVKDKEVIATDTAPRFFINYEIIKEKGKRIKEFIVFEINKQFMWKSYLWRYIDIPKYLLDYTGIKERIIYNIFRQLRMQKKAVLTLTILDLVKNTGILEKPNNLHNKRNRIIKPIEKALQEITEDKKQTYIKIDLSKVNNIDLTKFINSKLEITVIYNNAFLTEKCGIEIEESQKDTKKVI